MEWCGGNIRSQRSAWWDEIAWQDLRVVCSPKKWGNGAGWMAGLRADYWMAENLMKSHQF
ncbi:hypothetical protein DXT08_00825 [Escherichia coli]|nr:hypothetical protein [Escherichia coli]